MRIRWLPILACVAWAAAPGVRCAPVPTVNSSADVAPGVIKDVHINSAAAIAWAKVNKAGSNLTDLATRHFGGLDDVTISVAPLNALDPTSHSGQVPQSTGSSFSWITVTGFANPMTTLGDVITGGASGTATRLAGPTSATKQYLTSTGTGSAATAPVWTPLLNADLPAAGGDLSGSLGAASVIRVQGNAFTVPLVGNDGQFLFWDNASGTYKWGVPGGTFTNPMTTLGDLIFENATPAPARLAGNATGVHQFLGQTGTGSVSAAPAWAALVTGDLPSATPTTASGTVNAVPKVTATGPVTYGDSSLTDDAVAVKTSETYWTKHGASSNTTSPTVNPGTFGFFSDQQPTVSTTSTAYRSLFFWEEPGSGSNVAKSFRGLEGDATTAPLDTGVYTNANAFLGALIQSLYAGDSPGSAAGSIGVFAIAGKSAGIGGSTGTGVLTAAKAVEAQVSAAGTGGSITNGYGVYVLDAGKSGSATIGTDYGLYLENQDKGTTNYTMYSAGGVNAFAGSPSASATSSQLMIGPAAIAAGSSSGNYVGINATAGYGGYFTEYEVNGVAKQFLDASGNLTLAGKSTVVGTVNTGGMKVHRTAVASGSYTILVTDYYVAVTGTSGATLTLPSAATAGAGAVLIVKDAGRGAGASNITINRAGSDTIDGATSLVMATNAQSVTLISDGVTNWEAN